MKTTKVLKRTAKFMRTAIVEVKTRLEFSPDFAYVTLGETKRAIAAIDKALADSDSNSPHVDLNRKTLETSKCCVYWVNKYTALYMNNRKALADYELTMEAWMRVS